MKDRQIQRNLRERTLPPTVPSGTQLAPAPAAREPPAGSRREALQRTRARPRAPGRVRETLKCTVAGGRFLFP